jgi:hypothetical protein
VKKAPEIARLWRPATYLESPGCMEGAVRGCGSLEKIGGSSLAELRYLIRSS